MTWRSCWDGKRGPIATTWGVSARPTYCVLDARGVIRYVNPQGDLFDQAIDRLMTEMEAGGH
jgi:hypothetical protein